MDLKAAAPHPRRHVPWRRPAEGTTTIGVVDPCYGSSRVVFGLPTSGYTHATVSKLPLRRLDRKSTFHQFTPLVLDFNVPLLHTWNAIPRNKRFVMSFELEIPRYLGSPTDDQIRFGLDQLRQDRCRKLLPLSEFAMRHAMRVFKRYGYEDLSSKLQLFRGGVWDPFAGGEPPVPDPKSSDGPFSAIVIGTQLFRKGGMYAIEAFERLRAKGLDVRLTLVGDFETTCYAFRQELPDANMWRARARSHEWITFLPPVPFAEVYRLLLAHDVCLYPSLDESLGWLPIEAAMAGKPVIAARVAAFPEFVHHGKTGYLIDIALTDNERWEGLGVENLRLKTAVMQVREKIIHGIIDAIQRMVATRSLGRSWGTDGRLLMLNLYEIGAAGNQLRSIYESTNS